ncbi:MAG: hypothetical protein R3D52_01370 [Xanthobacteraceae bacterium]
MRTALAISVIAHGLLWVPAVWVARGPLPAATHEIAVELVPSDKLDEMTKAQAAAKPEVPDAATDQKAEAQSSPSAQRQEQPNQQTPRQEVQPTPPAQTAQTAPSAQAAQPASSTQTEQPAEMAALEPQAAQFEPAPDDAQLPVSWINSPLMTASVGFEVIPSAAKLSDREIATLKARVKECWTPPASLAEADAQKLVVVLRVSLQRNGALTGEPTLLAASASPKGAALLQTAKHALRQCQPFGFLPSAKYKEWKKLDLGFSPAGLTSLPEI